MTQQLLQTADGQGRVVAAEVLVATPAIRNLIREGKVHQIYSAMQAGGRFGMQTMDMSLAGRVKAGRINQQMLSSDATTPKSSSVWWAASHRGFAPPTRTTAAASRWAP